MNPARWRPLHLFGTVPSLDRVADCWFHGVNVECPHPTREACEAAQNVSVGFIISGTERSSPRAQRGGA